MTKQLMIYERAVPVSSENHRDHSVRMGRTFAFARDVNSVPLLATEILQAAGEYSIVFAGEGDNVVPTAILGADTNVNAYVAEDGSWTGGYIPAFLRRYPFVFAGSDDGSTFTLCVDEEFEDLNTEGRGERLFDADGNRTQFLNTMLEFSREYQAAFERTSLFCKMLVENDVLEPATAQFNIAGGEQRSLSGFRTIDREKLKALSAEKLAELVKNDALELCYAQIHSLRNLTPMAQKVAENAAA